MTAAGVLAFLLVLSLHIYVLTGGADFGAGVWDGLAWGNSGPRQRALIKNAMAPIWEANHVWLIVMVVILFGCFPLAWSAITTALHIPLTVMLFGVVLRGSALVFRSHTGPYARMAQRWNGVFALASALTPVALGVCLAAVAGGKLRVSANTWTVRVDFFEAWVGPFPLAVGLMTLALFVFLAAVYLCVESQADAELAAAFRVRALASGLAMGPLALGTLWLSHAHAPLLWAGLMDQMWSAAWQGVTAMTAVGALLCLWRRWFAAARVMAAAQASLVIWGFALAQHPYMITPDVLLGIGTAPPHVLRAVAWLLGLGVPLLVPAFVYLYWVFKGPGALRLVRKH